MANRMKQTQYNQIKNEEYAIVKFKDGERKSTIRGCSFYEVVEEMVEHTRGPMVVLVINEKDISSDEQFGNSRRIEDYEKYFKMERKLT